jgi:hypothetical protein
MPPVTRAPRVVRANLRGPNDRGATLAHHGWFYSWKTDRMLPYRGLLAFDFLNLAEAHPRVLAIRSKGRAVAWWSGATWEIYRPRYTLILRTGVTGVTSPLDVEVLPSFEHEAERLKYDRIRRECRREGRHFRVFTEKAIRIEPRLTNAKIVLSQAGRGLVPDRDRAVIRRVAHDTEDFTLNGLVAAGVLPYARAYAAALNLVAAGELAIPLARQFDGDSPIRRRV